MLIFNLMSGADTPRPVNPSEKKTDGEPRSGGVNRQLLQEALTAFYREDDETALELLLAILETNPDNLRCHYLAALTAANIADEETLEQISRNARRLAPRHPYTVGCEAVRALFFANYERAEHLFNLALRSLPDDIDLNLGLGILYDHMGAEEKSAEVYRRVLEISPDIIRARIWLGISYALSGEYGNALAQYEYAKRLDPTVENPHQHLGRDYYAEGIFDEAAREFARAIAEEPEQPTAYFYLMDCYKRLGLIDDALDIYETIKRQFAHQPEIISELFEHFRMFSEAIPHLEKLLQRSPENEELLIRLAGAYQETGRITDAIDAVQRAITVDPENPGYWTLLAELHYQNGDYPRTIAAAERAIQLNQYEEEAYAVLADALLFLGRTEEAEAMARQREKIRDESWRRYQQKFSGQDSDDDI